MKTINDEDFANQFRPIKNPHNKNASWDGSMFETYGVELNFVKNQPATTIWTVLDNGSVISGFHYVDRVGYLVTENPWTEDTEVS